MTEQYDNVREITRLNAHITRQDAENERLRAALKVARAALTANTIGTIHMDDPDWYRQVDQAVAEIDAALSAFEQKAGK